MEYARRLAREESISLLVIIWGVRRCKSKPIIHADYAFEINQTHVITNKKSGHPTYCACSGERYIVRYSRNRSSMFEWIKGQQFHTVINTNLLKCQPIWVSIGFIITGVKWHCVYGVLRFELCKFILILWQIIRMCNSEVIKYAISLSWATVRRGSVFLNIKQRYEVVQPNYLFGSWDQFRPNIAHLP